jgi:phytanoyl-CoA hydroxylase
MRLTPAQLADYDRLGYATVPDFFDAAEIAVMRAELDRLVAAGLLRNVATEGDGRTISSTAQNLQICPLSGPSRVFRSLPFAAKVAGQFHQVLRAPCYLRLDQIFLKPAHHGAGTSWHQDNGYFRDGADGHARRGAGMWIALHDATVANGTMRVIPGAFDRTLDHRRDPGSDHHITCRVDESRAVPIELPAGGILLFNWGVPHCTTANRTDRARAGLALHAQDLALRPEVINEGFHHPVLTGDSADGGRSIYGEDLRGSWERMVAPVAALATA